MIEIPSDRQAEWVLDEKVLAPKSLDTLCPTTDCGRSLVNLQLKWHRSGDFAWAQAFCKGCSNKITFFLLNLPAELAPAQLRAAQLFMFPRASVRPIVEPGIRETSPAFVEILGQIREAEALGLDALVGIGYRKALEYLIKDHLCRKFPDRAMHVRATHLGKCIKELVEDANLKACAERAAWLGNDETHYERRWEDRDIEDLKILLQLTRHWISNDYLTEEYKRRMTANGSSMSAPARASPRQH